MKQKLAKGFSEHGPAIALLIMVIVLSVISESFLSTTNLLNLLRQVSINAIIAFGMTLVILTGGIDLSVGSILALGSALTAGMLSNGISPIIAIVVGLFLGFLLGFINGIIITKGKLAPFIATLATTSIYRGLTLVYTDGQPISGLSSGVLFRSIGKGYVFGIPVPVIIMFVVFFIVFYILKNTVFGRHVYAIGGNEEAAKLSGIKTETVKIWIYSIIGMLSVFAGIILTSRLNSAQPTSGVGFELDAIASVVIGGTSLNGGRGKIQGTLIGALIIGVISNGLNILGVSSFYQQIAKGGVILLAVLIDRKNKN